MNIERREASRLNLSGMESRKFRWRHRWWVLTGLAFLEMALVRWLSEPTLTHSVLYYPERAPVVLEPSLALQITVYGGVVAVILIPFLAFWISRRASV
jgi:hypothetical protein